MKPEKGLSDMEDKLYDPRELFGELGLLITEARISEAKKGRVEGPHCPPLTGSNNHECDRHKEQCRKASDIQCQQDILWQNKIPMRIDVLLFPDCEHGYREETIVEGAMFSCMDNFELLERWDIQMVKKRSAERMCGFVSGHVHLQAARSYLHFSQLSSWLISTGGTLPLRVVYRVYAPGESVGYTFSKLPEVHTFPSADLGDVIMRTSVAHLTRQENPMLLFCRSPSPGVEQHLRSRKLTSEEKCLPACENKFEKKFEPRPSTSKCEDEDQRKSGQHKPRHSKDHMEYGKNTEMSQPQQMNEKPPIGRKLIDGKVDRQSKWRIKNSAACPMSSTPKRKVDQLSPTIPDINKLTNPQCSHSDDFHDNQTNFVYPKTKSVAMPTNNSMMPTTTSNIKSVSSDYKNLKNAKLSNQASPNKNHPYKKPSTLTVQTSLMAAKRLPSPKVLVTGSKKPEPTVFKKRCLDLDKPESVPEKVDNYDYDYNFVNLKQLNEFTARDIHDLAKPLSPSDLEAYLSSLSNKAPRKPGASRLEDIPTTNCSFYLGDENNLEHNDKNTDTKVIVKHANETSTEVNVDSCDINDAKSCTTSLSDGNSSRCAKTFCDTDISTATASSSKDKGVNKDEKHVRALFRKSLSTSEVELGRVTLSLFDEGIENSTFKDDIWDLSADKSVYCDKRLGVDKLVEDSKNDENAKLPSLDAAFVITNVEKDNKNVTSPPNDKIVEQNSKSNLNIQSSKSLNQSNSPSKKSQTREIISNNSREATVTHSGSKRERTLELSIPCRIGNDTVMSSLEQNLETMEIDDRSAQTKTPPSKVPPSSINPPSKFSASPSNNTALDIEVETHLNTNNRDNANSIHCDNNKHLGENSSSPSFDGSENSPASIGLSLCKQLLRKEFHQNVENEILRPGQRSYRNLPSPDDIKNFQFIMGNSACALFNTSTGLPSRSSPAPIKKQSSSNRFDYDCSLTNVRAIKNALSCSKLTLQSEDHSDPMGDPRVISTSAPASTHCLLGNFEESVLNGRIEPVGVVDGFTVEIGAGGTFCPKHVVLPVAAYFFQLSDDNAPSPYLGHVNLEPLGKRGYHIPRNGTVQVTLFNPNKSVVKMFVVMYDLSDMPASCQTFLRQRTIYMPAAENSSDPSYLRYLIHLRFLSSKTGKIYLHTDIRLIFARDKFEFDPKVANYELRSFTEGPENPKFSPKR